MSTYTYIKSITQDKLIQELTSANLMHVIDSIDYNGNILTINTSRDLSEEEFSALYKTISEHTPIDIVDERLKNRISSAIAFGQSLIIEVAIENIKLNLTPQQIILILTRFAGIKQMLETGSLYTALETMEKIKPDAIMTQERIDKYKNKLKKYLGV